MDLFGLEYNKCFKITRLLLDEYGPILKHIFSNIELIDDIWLRKRLCRFIPMLVVFERDLMRFRTPQLKFICEFIILVMRSFYQVSNYNYGRCKTILNVTEEALNRLFARSEEITRNKCLTQKMIVWFSSASFKTCVDDSFSRNDAPLLLQPRIRTNENSQSVEYKYNRYDSSASREPFKNDSIDSNFHCCSQKDVKCKHLLADPRLKSHNDIFCPKDRKHMKEHLLNSADIPNQRQNPLLESFVGQSHCSNFSYVQNKVSGFSRIGGSQEWYSSVQLGAFTQETSLNASTLLSASENLTVNKQQYSTGVNTNADRYQNDQYSQSSLKSQNFRSCNEIQSPYPRVDVSENHSGREKQDSRYSCILRQSDLECSNQNRFRCRTPGLIHEPEKVGPLDSKSLNIFPNNALNSSSDTSGNLNSCKKRPPTPRFQGSYNSCDISQLSSQNVREADFDKSLENDQHKNLKENSYHLSNETSIEVSKNMIDKVSLNKTMAEGPEMSKKITITNPRDPRAKYSIRFRSDAPSAQVSHISSESVSNPSVKTIISGVKRNHAEQCKQTSEFSKDNLRERLCKEISAVHKIGFKLGSSSKLNNTSDKLDSPLTNCEASECDNKQKEMVLGYDPTKTPTKKRSQIKPMDLLNKKEINQNTSENKKQKHSPKGTSGLREIKNENMRVTRSRSERGSLESKENELAPKVSRNKKDDKEAIKSKISYEKNVKRKNSKSPAGELDNESLLRLLEDGMDNHLSSAKQVKLNTCSTSLSEKFEETVTPKNISDPKVSKSTSVPIIPQNDSATKQDLQLSSVDIVASKDVDFRNDSTIENGIIDNEDPTSECTPQGDVNEILDLTVQPRGNEVSDVKKCMFKKPKDSSIFDVDEVLDLRVEKKSEGNNFDCSSVNLSISQDETGRGDVDKFVPESNASSSNIIDYSCPKKSVLSDEEEKSSERLENISNLIEKGSILSKESNSNKYNCDTELENCPEMTEKHENPLSTGMVNTAKIISHNQTVSNDIDISTIQQESFADDNKSSLSDENSDFIDGGVSDCLDETTDEIVNNILPLGKLSSAFSQSFNNNLQTMDEESSDLSQPTNCLSENFDRSNCISITDNSSHQTGFISSAVSQTDQGDKSNPLSAIFTSDAGGKIPATSAISNIIEKSSEVDFTCNNSTEVIPSFMDLITPLTSSETSLKTVNNDENIKIVSFDGHNTNGIETSENVFIERPIKHGLLEKALDEIQLKRRSKMENTLKDIALDSSIHLDEILLLEEKLNIKVCLSSSNYDDCEDVSNKIVIDKKIEQPFSSECIPGEVIFKDCNFSVGCLHAQQVSCWRYRYDCLCDQCSFSSSNHVYFQQHLEIRHDGIKEELPCSVCPFVTKSIFEAFKHVQQHCFMSDDEILYSTETDVYETMSSLLKSNELNYLSLFKNLNLSPEFPVDLQLQAEVPKINNNENTLESNSLKYHYLANIFKCNSDVCKYSTNKSEEYKNHISKHIQKKIIDNNEKWKQCPYCNVVLMTAFSAHIILKHGNSIYQCPDCFYRSCSSGNVSLHKLTHHKEMFSPLILRCGEVDTIKKCDKTNISVSVAPYECFFKYCNYKSCLMDGYINHLWEHPIKMLTCFICKARYYSLDSLTKHFEHHLLAPFHCSYCQFSTLDPKQLLLHLSDEHPSLLPKVIIRVDFTSCSAQAEEQFNDISPYKTDFEILIEVNLESWMSKKLIVKLLEMENPCEESIENKRKLGRRKRSCKKVKITSEKGNMSSIDSSQYNCSASTTDVSSNVERSPKELTLETDSLWGGSDNLLQLNEKDDYIFHQTEENSSFTIIDEMKNFISGFKDIRISCGKNKIRPKIKPKSGLQGSQKEAIINSRTRTKYFAAAEQLKNPQIPNYQCSCCLIELYTIQGLVDHFNNHHKNMVVQFYLPTAQSPNLIQTKGSLICYWCSMLFIRKSDLILHSYSYHSRTTLKFLKQRKVFQCPYCKFVDSAWDNMVSHYYCYHFSIFICETCKFWHSDESIVLSHCSSNHPKKVSIKSVSTNLYQLNNGSPVNTVFSNFQMSCPAEFITIERLKESQLSSALYRFHQKYKEPNQCAVKSSFTSVRYVTRSKANKIKMICESLLDEEGLLEPFGTSIKWCSSPQLAKKSTTAKIDKKKGNKKDVSITKAQKISKVPQTARKSTFSKFNNLATIVGKTNVSLKTKTNGDMGVFKIPAVPATKNNFRVTRSSYKRLLGNNKIYDSSTKNDGCKTDLSTRVVIPMFDLKRFIKDY